MNGKLILRRAADGNRHFLAGAPVHCGTMLRLRVSSGCQPDFWVWARYEANLGAHPTVMLHTVFGRLLPDEGTCLRWPTEGER